MRHAQFIQPKMRSMKSNGINRRRFLPAAPAIAVAVHFMESMAAKYNDKFKPWAGLNEKLSSDREIRIGG